MLSTLINLSRSPEHLKPFSLDNSTAKGFEAFEAPKLLGLTDFAGRMVATSVVGRTASSTTRVFEWLLNPTVRMPRDTLDEPLLNSLLKNTTDKKIEMADFGCGGAADAPLLQRLVSERLLPLGVEFSFKSYDLDRGVVQAVKNGKAPYFNLGFVSPVPRLLMENFDQRNYPLSLCDDRIVDRVLKYLAEDFTLIGKSKVSTALDFFPILEEEDKYSRVYTMHEDLRSAIDISVGDIQRTGLPDRSLHIVSCFNVALYLRDYQRYLAFKEVERILKEDGLFITDGAVFQKRSGRLGPAPISGYASQIQSGPEASVTGVTYSDGLHPTVYRNGGYETAAVRLVNPSGSDVPHYGFIGADSVA